MGAINLCHASIWLKALQRLPLCYGKARHRSPMFTATRDKVCNEWLWTDGIPGVALPCSNRNFIFHAILLPVPIRRDNIIWLGSLLGCWSCSHCLYSHHVDDQVPSIIQRPIGKLRTRALTLYRDANIHQFSSPCETCSRHKVQKWFNRTVTYTSDVTLCCSNLFENCSVASLAHFSWQWWGMHISRVWCFTRGTATL